MAAAKLTGVNNLVKLLPTTTLMAFQTLNPSFSNKGQCYLANKYLSGTLLTVCSITCALASITDSFTDHAEGHTHFGFATPSGFHVLNLGDDDAPELDPSEARKLRLRVSDAMHMVLTVMVFLALAMSDPYVQTCFFQTVGDNGKQWLSNLPLGMGFLATAVFLVMPQTRKGIGYANVDVLRRPPPAQILRGPLDVQSSKYPLLKANNV